MDFVAFRENCRSIAVIARLFGSSGCLVSHNGYLCRSEICYLPQQRRLIAKHQEQLKLFFRIHEMHGS